MAKGRGLASASKATRIRVAREGGKASHGGGRKKGTTNQTFYSEVRSPAGKKSENETDWTDM